MHHKIKVLFIGEGVSLAHVVRPLVLADSLDKQTYDVYFACDRIYHKFVKQYPTIKYFPIKSISPEKFMRSLYYGKTIYNKKTLCQYLEEDQRIINEINPDLIIGDFRTSLSISSKICKKPHFSLTNAHWSPFAENSYESPETIYTKYMGFDLANFIFKLAYLIAFKQQAQPFNSIANKNKIDMSNDIRDMYTRGDKVLYLDPPDFVAMKPLPENHHFIGPIIWSPKIQDPVWLNQIKSSTRNIYATFGSSGLASLLPKVCDGILKSNYRAIIATANRVTVDNNPKIFQADFLPGETILDNCQLAICNGGSATVYQALSRGVPVIGIPQNLDQFLTMQCIEKRGLGILIRPKNATPSQISKTINEINQNPQYQKNVNDNIQNFQNIDSIKKFTLLVDKFFTVTDENILTKQVS